MGPGQSAHSYRDKRRAIISVQWVVVIGTSYLVLFNKGQVVEDSWALFTVLVFLASALVIQKLPQSVFSHKFFPHALVVADTIFISIAGREGRSGERTIQRFNLYSSIPPSGLIFHGGVHG